MNKKELDEVLKIMNEPITVNSVEYKFFTQEQYDNLIRVYENAKWLVEYSLQRSRFISNLNERIENAIEFMDTLCDEYADDDYDIKCTVFDKLYQILKGDNE